MNRVSIALENCYGIKKLNQGFDFTRHRTFAIYAPNGMMKSSLAQTFEDLIKGVPSKDRIFPDRNSRRSITDEQGFDLTKESLLVIRPYDSEFSHTEKTSTLLVDSELRKEYEQLHLDIGTSKAALLKALKEQSGSKKNLEKEISSAFTTNGNEFDTALCRIKKELQQQKDTPFADIPYDKIFDQRVLSVLEASEVKTALEDYVQRYNELLANSTYFKKGTFDYYNAGQIAKSLADNGFFDAKHTVNLKAGEDLEITTQEQLEEVIANEKDSIIKDQKLRQRFDAVETLLGKNISVRDFRTYIMEHEAFLSQLANIPKFKEDIWKSYLKVHFNLYSEFIEKYEAAETRKSEIEDEAARQQTQWEEVIDMFNNLFFVPFKLGAKNRLQVMLGNERILELEYTYQDGADNASVNKDELMKTLSTGEKKALYILNVMFEIETRKKAGQETLIIVDDIADSFDYQNKYAIIQYLKEVSHNPLFKQIIMTHNFDFFRTISSRFVGYGNCLMTLRNNTGIKLEKASGIRNVFVNDWKKAFFQNPKKKIASIPFLRNLVEYTKGESDPSFITLTSLVHWKNNSTTITNAHLDNIFNVLCGTADASPDPGKSVIDIIFEQAQACSGASTGINLENKVVLSIAIRLRAEQFMVTKINNTRFVARINKTQTQKLFEKYANLFGGEIETLKVLDRVLLITPENIHLNSFMYEPIVDMSDDHLRKLYHDVLALK